jgi:hypothetical protein
MANGENGNGEKPIPPHKRTREYRDSRISSAIATAGRCVIDVGERLLRLSQLYPTYGQGDQQTFIADIDYILKNMMDGWARAKVAITTDRGHL